MRFKIVFISFLCTLLSGIVIQANGQTSDGIDSLKHALEKATIAQEKLEVLIVLSDQISYIDANEARKYGYRAIKIAGSLNDEKALGNIYRNIGVSHEGQGNFDSALYYQKLSLEKFQELEDSLEIAGVLNNIGIVYDVKGDNELATKNYLQAARIYEKMGSIDGMAKGYNNLGIIYKKTLQFNKALEYYLKALQIYEEMNHKFGIAVSHNNIGSVYLELKDFKQSIEHSEEAVKKYNEINVLQYLPYAYENMGIAYARLGVNDSAFYYHNKALKLYNSYGNKKEMAFTLISLAELSHKENELYEAKRFAQRGLEVSDTIEAYSEQMKAFKILASINYDLNNHKIAFDQLRKFQLIKDSIDNVEKSAAIASMQTKYESEKKEQEIKILQAETKLKDVKLNTSRARLIGLAAMSGLIIIVGLLVINRRELKQKALLAEERRQQHQKQLNAMVKAEENERRRIARELHDGVGQQLSGIKMAFEAFSKNLLDKVGSKEKGIIHDLTKYLHESSEEVRSISHQMMPKSLMELGLLSAIDDLLEKSFKYSSIKPSFEHYNMDERISENVEVTLYRIAQELLNNIIKHADATEVSVQLIKGKENLRLLIEDNGKGMNLKNSEGHGIENIKNRLALVNGAVSYEESPSGGTVATVKIPLKNDL